MLWEAIKGLGALAGLFATAHILRDRYYRFYPSAIIIARPLIDGGVEAHANIRIKNVSERPILVSWTDGNLAQLRIAKDNSIHGIVRTLFEGQSTISVAPGETRILPLLKPQNFDDIDDDNPLPLDLKWKFAQPIVWQRQRLLRVWIRKKDLDDLLKGFLPPQ